MARAISKRITWSFTTPDDTLLPEDERTVFQLRSLDGLQWIDVQGAAEVGRSLVSVTYRMAAAACMCGLLGWKNLRHEDGTEIPFPGTGDAAVRLLEPEVIAAIGTEIMSRSRLGGKEVGKSMSLSGSSGSGTESSASPVTKPVPAAPSAGEPQVPVAAPRSGSPALNA